METFLNYYQYISDHILELILTLILILVYYFLRLISKRLVKRHAHENQFAVSRELYVKKLINVGLFIILIFSVGTLWEISIKGLSFYFASIFTVVGVGLFATWSMLSNLTASVILFFFFPHRIGGKVKIIDGDNSVEGTILDISLFYIQIETTEKQVVSYPNNLAIQKPFIQIS